MPISTGVPSTREPTSTGRVEVGMLKASASAGLRASSGTAVTSQAAISLPAISAHSGRPLATMASSVPSAWSCSKSLGSASMTDSSAATQITPGPMR